MSLSDHRFFRSRSTFRRNADGAIFENEVYSYESTGGLYDVMLVQGAFVVRFNTGSWQPIRECHDKARLRFYNAIIQKYDLKED